MTSGALPEIRLSQPNTDQNAASVSAAGKKSQIDQAGLCDRFGILRLLSLYRQPLAPARV